MYRKIAWPQQSSITPTLYKCGHCGAEVAPDKGWRGEFLRAEDAKVLICPLCSNPTYISPEGRQFPSTTFGVEVNNISDLDVKLLYKEARDSFSVEGYTASVLCCRKLLMHIAVAKGAATNLTFIKYVEYFSDNNYIPPDAKIWVDYIRQKGNEANHEIMLMAKDDAEDLLTFVSMLLRVTYEFPFTIKSRIIKTP